MGGMPSPEDGVQARPRRSLGPYRNAALVLLVLGVLCLLVELQSPSLIFWTGERVQGTNDGGLVYYTVDGQERTLDAGGDPPSRPVPVAVYADPADASRDRVSGPAKWFDAAFVTVPFAAAGVLVLVGVVRRRGGPSWPRRGGPAVRPDRAGGPRPSRSSRSTRSSR
jgi:hypothetical protein